METEPACEVSYSVKRQDDGQSPKEGGEEEEGDEEEACFAKYLYSFILKFVCDF
jgi:hypothetical protein